MRNTLIAILLCTIFLSLNAQENKINLSTNRNKDNSIDIDFEKTDPGSYTIFLNLSSLENSNHPNKSISIKGYRGRLTSLKPANKDRPVNFSSYRSSSIRGRLQPKIDTDIVYALPYKEGTKITAREATYLRSTYFGATEPEDWKSYRFYTSEKSEVTASRKGIVVELEAMEDDTGMQDVSYTSKTNYIIIEHEDGTLLRYSGFAKGSIKVKIGDTVYPSDVLGENIMANNGYSISYMVYYLKSDDIESTRDKNMRESKSLYGFITPHFSTESGAITLEKDKEYTSTINEDIIQKEMSKRELKRHKESK